MLGQEFTKKQIQQRNAEKLHLDIQRQLQREQTKKEREQQGLEKAKHQEAKRQAIADREAQMVAQTRAAAEYKDQFAARKAAEDELVR